MNKPTLDKSKILFILCFAVIITVMYLIQFGCVFQRLFGIICPGCGMTRAVLSILRFDFMSAFEYHGMFWSLPICALYFLCDGRPFKSNKLNIAIVVAIGVGFLVNWFVHLTLV